VGASLGPSFALVLIGGGLGSWISRRWSGSDDAREDYTLTGIAGGFGGAFTSPGLGAFIVTELAPTPRGRYVAAFIPQLLAAVISFSVFYGVAGRTFLEMYALPGYDFELVHLAVAAGLGIVSALVMILLVVVIKLVAQTARGVTTRTNLYVLGLLGGAAIGLAAFALPLTMSSGNTQLGTVLDDAERLGAGLLCAVLMVKMLAVALSLGIGFMGGNVFPLIFLGGTAGTIVHVLVPDVPYALAVSCMLAAVPGSYLRAPISLMFIAVITVGLSGATAAPVAVAVVSAYLTAAVIMWALRNRRDDQPMPTPA
jgi:H+/Cl- antiporter ClcA